MQIDADKLDVLVGRLYEAAVRPELWRTVLHELALAMDARGARILYHRPDGASPHTVSEGLDAVIDALFAGDWHRHNPREARARRRGMARSEIITDADLFSTEELDREPWQRDFLDRFGLRWFASFNVMERVWNSPLVLTIERPTANGPFSTAALDRLRSVVSHVQRASEMSSVLATATRSGLLDGFNRMGQGAILLDDRRCVVAFNEAAERHFDHGLSVVASRLMATSPMTDIALQSLIAGVTGHSRAHASAMPVTIHRPNLYPIIVEAAPLSNSVRDFFQEVRALLILKDLDQAPALDLGRLQAIFGFTTAEARIAQAIARGHPLTDIAERLTISIHTIRSHLKSVFNKTGTHSQTQLAILLGRLHGPSL